ncbi:MAG: radical SAM protein [Halieaceae bacterium]|nr:radical SAM protein [Halieaceae bacterium]
MTAEGKPRAQVAMVGLRTLWFCTGTLCNLSCENCYIESTPTNDRLLYLSLDEVTRYLDEIETLRLPTREIGVTGGEPFMNPQIIEILEAALLRGFDVLVLTNAMRPMMKLQQPLLQLHERFGSRLTVRVSLDHYREEMHERERGPRSWKPTIQGLRWLSHRSFCVHVAGRMRWGESEAAMRRGYAELFASNGIAVDHTDKQALVLFPEMGPGREVPEISTACWDILGLNPADIMCATSRMVVKHRGADEPCVAACTLLPYEPEFNLARTLAESLGPISLNHEHCARFCVLGGGSCS